MIVNEIIVYIIEACFVAGLLALIRLEFKNEGKISSMNERIIYLENSHNDIKQLTDLLTRVDERLKSIENHIKK